MILHLMQTLISVRCLFFELDSTKVCTFDANCDIVVTVSQNSSSNLFSELHSIWSFKITQSRLNSITAYVPRMLFFNDETIYFVYRIWYNSLIHQLDNLFFIRNFYSCWLGCSKSSLFWLNYVHSAEDVI